MGHHSLTQVTNNYKVTLRISFLVIPDTSNCSFMVYFSTLCTAHSSAVRCPLCVPGYGCSLEVDLYMGCGCPLDIILLLLYCRGRSIYIYCTVVFLNSGTCVNTFCRNIILGNAHSIIAQPNSYRHNRFKLTLATSYIHKTDV